MNLQTIEKENCPPQRTEQTYEGEIHSYDPGELKAFIGLINDLLCTDIDIGKYLPLKDALSLTNACKDGILLCKLINAVSHGVIDIRAIDTKVPLTIYKMTENLNLAIYAAMSIGCCIVNITPQAIINEKIHLLMGMLWQIMRVYLLERISLRNNPGVALLSQPEESLEDILKLSSEKILVRWINYKLKMGNQNLNIKEIGNELKDLLILTHIITQLDKSIDINIIPNLDLKERAKLIIESVNRLGIKAFINEEALLEGNPKIYLLFIASLFNARNDLVIPEEKKKQIEMVSMVEEIQAGTKEERTFQLWMNTLGMKGIYVNNIYDDLKDGLIILKIIDSIWPGSVVSGKYEKMPGHNEYKMIANGNYAISICREKKIITTGISGKGLADCNKLQILGILWQLMRANYLQVVGGKTEKELLEWANIMVNRKPKIMSFKDPQWKNSRFLIALMSKLEPEIVDWTLVKPGNNDEEIEMNAKYCISIARKLGAKIFLTYEDIKKVKIIFTYRLITKCLQSL